MVRQVVEIPGFDVLEKVGESALTEVWQAHQETLERDVALKFLKDEYLRDDQERQRFVREAQHAANLRHPNIIAIYNVMQHGDRDIVVMEHSEGESLYQQLETQGRMSWQRSSRVALAVAESLRYAWDEACLIHRNVSPTAIRLEPNGNVKFAFIGLSVRVDANNPTRRVAPGVIEGVPYYMSPEQARGTTALDCRTDMYGLGTTLYHMLTGHMPFSDFSPVDAVQQQLNGVLPYPSQFNPDIPPSLLFMLSKLLRKSPSDRYKNWDAVTAELGKIAAGHLVVPRKVRHVPSTLPADVRANRRSAGVRVKSPPSPAKARKPRRRIVVKKR